MERTLGDYQILKEMGVGALGALYLGHHSFLKRSFLLKVLPEDLAADQNFRKRFEELVAALASIDHPHLAKVHNISFSSGKYFLVSDFIFSSREDLSTLSDFLAARKDPLNEGELFSIVEQIASALNCLHEKGVSHGSISLNNVFISNDGKSLSVSLADAGLSSLLSADKLLRRTYDVLLNDAHLSFFSRHFAFLPPEQRNLTSVDARAGDIYAFGVLVYYMIMGFYPEGFFSLPSQAHPEYKLAWDHLIIQCLQPDPVKRPLSLNAVVKALHGQDAKTEGTALKPKIKEPELIRPEFDEDPGAIFQKDTSVAQFRPKPQEIKELDPILSEMVIIKGGNFHRGSNNGGRDEIPRHMITLDSFAIDIHPVTNEQFVRFLQAMGGEKDAQNSDIIRLRESRIKRSGGKLNIESGYSKHPVVGVTWYGAIAYAKWVGKRLPTEAEWEVAACGNLEDSTYPTGANIERSQANFFSSDTTTVMSYPPNSCGLYDMAGNVYEWCSDWYGYHYYDVSVQEPNNPPGPAQGIYRVLRGGCWKSLKEDMRCSHRHRNNPGTMNGTYGFRCAADVQ
ncbi:MAG: SUMF1/EgtB/PvdO family nonheme iron enzyme [Chlamydiales bacterium]|nr:SUMF1/EgtB/PvdO family nonheme iron enzyme [Chlamydiales bacterium]